WPDAPLLVLRGAGVDMWVDSGMEYMNPVATSTSDKAHDFTSSPSTRLEVQFGRHQQGGNPCAGGRRPSRLSTFERPPIPRGKGRLSCETGSCLVHTDPSRLAYAFRREGSRQWFVYSATSSARAAGPT